MSKESTQLHSFDRNIKDIGAVSEIQFSVKNFQDIEQFDQQEWIQNTFISVVVSKDW